MAKQLIVYTRTTCAYCGMVKKFLDMKQQPYEVVNLDEQPERTDAVINLSGARTVPVVTSIEDNVEKVVSIGWNPAALSSAIS